MLNAGILYGPDEDFQIPKESVGKYFLDRLRKRNPDDVLALNPVTEEKLTVGSFVQETIKTIKAFKRLNLKKDDVVAFISENSLKYCIPVVAALNIGVIVMPINPLYTEGEIRHCLEISKPKLILCSREILERAKNIRNECEIEMIVTVGMNDPIETDIVNLETLLKLENDYELEQDNFDATETGAFILLSSGTTGLPKGVLLTHSNFGTAVDYLLNPRYTALTCDDTTIQCLPFFHIFGLLIFFVGVSTGMNLIILDKFKANIFLQCIQDHKVTKLFVVPPILLLLAKSPLAKNYDLSSIKDIVVGGAPVSKELQKNALESIAGTTVRQMYGMTELSGAVTFQTFSDNSIGTVGVLVPNVQAKVVEIEGDKILGPGKTGELCFKGDLVMKEYYRNDDATRNCIDKDGFLHTGDLGYYDENGQFYVVDRMKELIKYKGFQVAPAELEALLLTHPSIRDCGVIGIPDEKAGQLALAYIAATDPGLSQQAVIDYVAERISIEKRLYGGVIFIDEIPTSSSGKVLRKKLVEDFLNRKQSNSG